MLLLCDGGIGALIITYTILGAPYSNQSNYNVPQNPILVIKAPVLGLWDGAMMSDKGRVGQRYIGALGYIRASGYLFSRCWNCSSEV